MSYVDEVIERVIKENGSEPEFIQANKTQGGIPVCLMLTR